MMVNSQADPASGPHQSSEAHPPNPMEAFTGAEILLWRQELRAWGGDPGALDWLLDAVGGLSSACLQGLRLNPSRLFSLHRCRREIEWLWRQHLCDAVPLQYLVGHCFWRDFALEVGPAVLIPRPETELMVDLAVDLVATAPTCSSEDLIWADLGTGSGCLALGLARAFPKSQGLAVDVSREALAQAHLNLTKFGFLRRVRLVEGHWWDALRPWWGRLSLVLANPPYIPSEVVDQLDPLVRDHEPRLALDGGKDGLSSLRPIIAAASQSLAPGGSLLVEHHYDQSQVILELFAHHGLVNMASHTDLNGHQRFVSGMRPPASSAEPAEMQR
ncbi:MAG: hypothetical protein RLZZ117_1754 [Cyanobacteriota bacterium]